ncbi:hypothetical protein H4Q26_004005 [Puccinia striiformis f. sp. tritici PST-130]|nr:hypothetical protein H4Q26_004005 [Puccinia striiformis f. sp. tritici PST-130]
MSFCFVNSCNYTSTIDHFLKPSFALGSEIASCSDPRAKLNTETISMSSIPCIFSLGSERALEGEDPQGDYLDKINQHHGVSVFDASQHDVFYNESTTFEISAFYSGGDGELLPTHRRKPSMPKASKGVLVDAGLPCFPRDLKLPIQPDTITSPKKAEPTPLGSDARIETPSACLISNEGDPPIITAIGEQACRIERLLLVEPNMGESLTSSICQRLDLCHREVEFFYEKEVLSGPSFLSHSPALRIYNRNESSYEASEASLSKTSYLCQARKKLKTKSINRSIAVGHQPRRKGITPQEENECFQKIWLHRQNRIEAHQKMKSKLGLILEEEERREFLE